MPAESRSLYPTVCTADRAREAMGICNCEGSLAYELHEPCGELFWVGGAVAFEPPRNRLAKCADHQRFAQVERCGAMRFGHVALEELDEFCAKICREMRLAFHEQLARHARMRVA